MVEAARLRLRPILMTSLAFILGVLPLAISTGPGANARHAIGTGVIGGMLFATLLGLLLIPVFYVAMRRLLGDRLDPAGRATRTGRTAAVRLRSAALIAEGRRKRKRPRMHARGLFIMRGDATQGMYMPPLTCMVSPEM